MLNYSLHLYDVFDRRTQFAENGAIVMLSLNRRTLLLGLIAATAGLVVPFNTSEPARALVRLGVRRLRPTSTSIRFEMTPELGAVTKFAVMTEADGYFLYHAEFGHRGGKLSIIKFAHRLIPGKPLMLSLTEDSIRDVILHHTYLPFNGGTRTMELWGLPGPGNHYDVGGVA